MSYEGHSSSSSSRLRYRSYRCTGMSISSLHRLKAVRCDSHFEYQHIDRHSGRVRMHTTLFDRLEVRIGWVLRIRIHLAGGSSIAGDMASYDVLCSAWPDSDKRLGDSELCLSDSVVVAVDEAEPNFKGSSLEALQVTVRQRWRQGTSCTIMNSYPPTVCPFVTVALAADRAYEHSTAQSRAMIRGLPVATGAVLMMGGAMLAVVTSAPPGCIAVVLPSTIVSFKQQLVDTTTSSSTSSSNTEEGGCIDSSATFVVEEITRRIIDPLITAPAGVSASCLYRGLLLLGPPGVGKTHAVRAVRQRCRASCDVRIAELKLASLLAAESPLKELNASLELAAQRPQGGGGSHPGGLKAPSQKTYLYSPPSHKKDTDAPSSSSSNSSNSKIASSGKASRRPSVTFVMVDEIDALGTGDSSSEAQRAIKRRLCQWMDAEMLAASSDCHHLCVVATSNRPEDVDGCFRRGGRIELEVHVMPTKKDRRRVLEGFLAAYRSKSATTPFLSSLSDEALGALCDAVAECTGGYVTADLRALCDEAFRADAIAPPPPLSANEDGGDFTSAYQRVLHMLQAAMHSVAPSCLRGAVTKVDTRLTLDDVVGLEEAKRALCRVVGFSAPDKQEAVRRFGLSPPGGALLHGPPGNSKTRLVAAVAAHFNLPVISLSAADVYSAYVGVAEAEIRRAFRIARQASPCVLFIDEIDAIVTNRQLGGDGGSGGAEARVLATFLVEMDGISSASGSSCIVIAATNRLQAIDKALLRKGRFHHLLHVPAPGPEDQLKLLQYFVRKYSGSGGGLDIDTLRSKLREGMSGAEVEGLVKEEALALLRMWVAEKEGGSAYR